MEHGGATFANKSVIGASFVKTHISSVGLDCRIDPGILPGQPRTATI